MSTPQHGLRISHIAEMVGVTTTYLQMAYKHTEGFPLPIVTNKSSYGTMFDKKQVETWIKKHGENVREILRAGYSSRKSEEVKSLPKFLCGVCNIMHPGDLLAPPTRKYGRPVCKPEQEKIDEQRRIATEINNRHIKIFNCSGV